MLLINQVRMPVTSTKQDAISKAVKQIHVSMNEVAVAHIHKLSIDARKRSAPLFVYSVAVTLKDKNKEEKIAMKYAGVQLIVPQPFIIEKGSQRLPGRVVVCGFGPAGLFAALELAQAGFRPIVLERGPMVEQRRQAIEEFENGGALLPDANIQFGEGGAGTFSDGKLTTRIKDPLCTRVTQRLLEAGAPEEIEYKNKPHIGTDLLQGVIVNLRNQLIELGGEVHFNTTLEGIQYTKTGDIKSVTTNRGEISCGVLVLAVGHSARDTFIQLREQGLHFEPKIFSVGFRIEHLQTEIDKGLYHDAAGNSSLPVGEYQLSTKVGQRGVYTFCMCPGGNVVAAQSEPETVVTNGMSRHARAENNANSAIVANVFPEDFGDDPFAGIYFQRQLEQAAFIAGGKNHRAPAQTVGSFLAGSGKIEMGRVEPSYPRGVTPYNLGSLLPEEVAEAIRTALPEFGRKLQGFDAPDTMLTGLETRTSSPVRLARGEALEYEHINGLYPCGEGAGYAGGIMSAAVDGVRVAKRIAEKYSVT